MAVHNAPQTLTHICLGKNENAIKKIEAANDDCRRLDVQAEEKKIVFGGSGKSWFDVEADEVDLRKQCDDDAEPDENTTREPWGGVEQCGSRKTLFRINLQEGAQGRIHE